MRETSNQSQRILFFLAAFTMPLEMVGVAALGVDFSVARYPTIAFTLFTLYVAIRDRRWFVPREIALPIIWLLIAFVHEALRPVDPFFANLRSLSLNLAFFAACCTFLVRYPNDLAIGLAGNCVVTVAGVLYAVLIIGVRSYGDERFTLLEYDNNYIAVLLGFALMCAVITAQEPTFKLYIRILLLASALALVGLLVNTGSRGGFLSFLAALGAFLYVTFRRSSSVSRVRTKLAALLIVIIVAAIGVRSVFKLDIMRDRLDDSLHSVYFSGRDDLAFSAVRLIAQRPFLGWGETTLFDQLGRDVRGWGQFGPHNTYLLLLGVSGCFSGGLFIWFLLRGLFIRRHGPGAVMYQKYLPLFILYLTAFLSLDSILAKQFWLMTAAIYVSCVIRDPARPSQFPVPAGRMRVRA